MIRCAIYPRKSKAVDNSDSMEVQIDMCKRYLNDKYGAGNYSIEIYDGDYGITGHSIKARKDFQRMMENVRSGNIQLVVIQRYDRIARNTRDFCNLYHDMEQSGCNLVSVSQQIDTTTPYGKNFMYMQASMAELEWALCSERRKDALRYAASTGKCTFASHIVPLGYKKERIDGVIKLVKDDTKAPIVEEVFSHYKTYQNISLCARHINEQFETHYERNHIRRILRNPIYTGTYRGNTTFCPAYITKEEFDSLQSGKHFVRAHDDGSTAILFSGLIHCPICSRKMRCVGKTKTNKNGKKYSRYYHCEYVQSGLCNLHKTKSEILLEANLISYIDNYMEHYSTDIKVENVNKPKKNDGAKIQQEIDRLNKMYLKGRIDDDFYDAEYLRLTKLKDEYEASTKPENHSMKLDDVFFDNWKEIYESLDQTHRKIFWKSIIKDIFLDENMSIKTVIFL